MSENDCLCLLINFYLAKTYGRGENLKANMDGRSEYQLFLQENSVLAEFAPMLRYEIDIKFERTLLPVFPNYTQSEYQFQKGQIVECKRHSGDLELSV